MGKQAFAARMRVSAKGQKRSFEMKVKLDLTGTRMVKKTSPLLADDVAKQAG